MRVRAASTLAAVAALIACGVAATPALAQVDGAVGGVRSPAAGTLDLLVTAADGGPGGLRSATALLDDQVVDTAFFGDPECAPSPATPELACPATGGAALAVNTGIVADGDHRLVVRVTDGLGAVTTLVDQLIAIRNAPVVSRAVVVLEIGTRRPTAGQGDPDPDTPGGGEQPGGEQPGGGPSPGGGAANPCPRPRMSLRLAQRPLRFRRGVPVLAAKRRYRFTGRLTCRIDGRRVNAPRGTRIQIRTRRGKTIFRKPAVRVGRRGQFTARLRFGSAREVTFSLQGATGTLAAAKIRIRVVAVRGDRR